MSIRSRLLKVGQHSFIRSVGVLAGGTAIAQGVAILALPILTRLYSPEDFSILAVYAGLLGIISVAATLRFELAIPIAEKDNDATNLLALAILSSAVIAFIVLCIVLVIPGPIVTLLKQPSLQPYLWLLPLGILLTCCFNSLQFWAVRKKAFAPIANTRIQQSLAGAGVQIGLGCLGVLPLGLLLGQAINSGVGAFRLGQSVISKHDLLITTISRKGMLAMFHEHNRFPKFSTFEALANNANIQLPVVIIAALAIGPEAGYLALAMLVMQGPLGLIGGAIGQVYFARAPQEYKDGVLGLFTAKTLLGLINIGVGPMIFVGILAPDMFVFIFGDEWRRAGNIVAWLIPWFVLQLLASPISMALHVTNNQRAALILQVFGLILRVGAVLIASSLLPIVLVEAYAISGMVFYATYFFVVAKMVSLDWKIMFEGIFKKGIFIVLLWSILGVILLHIKKFII